MRLLKELGLAVAAPIARLVGGAAREPATWAMMLAGIGLVGVAMRRLRQRRRTARFGRGVDGTLARSTGAFLGAAAFAAMALPATAGQVFSTGYDMTNGGGYGSPYNFWDSNYSSPFFTGVGSTRADGIYLHGGSGALTDGIISTARWDTVTNIYGGPYVGWLVPGEQNPVILFHFDASPAITSIRLWIDNSHFGPAYAPQGVIIDGHAYLTSGGPAAGAQGALDFTGLNLSGGSHTLTLLQAGSNGVFVSEIEFFDSSVVAGGGVPEPATWALMIAGFGLVGAVLRRRGTAHA